MIGVSLCPGSAPQERTVVSTLSVCDSRTGFIAQPCLWIVLGQRLNVRVLHDHARTSVPSQDGVVVSRRGKIHGPLVVTHGVPQGVICGRTGSRIAVPNAGISQTLRNDAGVVGLLVVSFNLSENFLGSFRLYMGVELIGPRKEQGN